MLCSIISRAGHLAISHVPAGAAARQPRADFRKRHIHNAARRDHSNRGPPSPAFQMPSPICARLVAAARPKQMVTPRLTPPPIGCRASTAGPQIGYGGKWGRRQRKHLPAPSQGASSRNRTCLGAGLAGLAGLAGWMACMGGQPNCSFRDLLLLHPTIGSTCPSTHHQERASVGLAPDLSTGAGRLANVFALARGPWLPTSFLQGLGRLRVALEPRKDRKGFGARRKATSSSALLSRELPCK